MSFSLRLVSMATAAAALCLAPAASAQCVGLGGGGAFPGTGAVDGTWPTVMPTAPLVSTLAVTVPSGATVLNSVKLNGLAHTWTGDMQIVLQDPNGGLHNIFQDVDGVFAGGCADVTNGDYVFVDPINSSACGGVPSFTCGSGTFAPGTYAQHFGAWPSGSSGINNTALEQIPISSGNWTLYIYDWYIVVDNGTLTSFELCFGSPSTPPTGGAGFNCVSGGTGGAFPTSGAVDGTWPTTLPTGQLSSTLAVTVPAGATKIKAVKVNGLTHSWLGDCQIVLETPSGQMVNVFQQVDGVFGGGCADSFVGDYTFVDATVALDECGNPAGAFGCSGLGSLPVGTYAQFYGAWPTGSSSIDNADLESVSIASGNYTLHIYDWFVGADAGNLSTWELCFDAASTPTTFCLPNPGGTTNGCVPTIAASGHPNLTHTAPCVITASGVEGQKLGLIFYGVSGQNNIPWCLGGSSFLCVKAPTQRMPSGNTGGTAGACDGTMVQDWNTFQLANPFALGNPWTSGATVDMQGWFRDPPACKTTSLTEGVRLIYQ